MPKIPARPASLLVGVALCIALSSIPSALFGADIKYGQISAAEWALQPPPGSAPTPAIVLYKGGSLRVGGGEAKAERHFRFKILNRLAVDKLVNVEIAVSKYEHFGDFRAQTILPNGKKFPISVFELKKKKLGDSYQVYSFAFPRVEDGCIIEYQYDISGQKDVWFFNWNFQNDYFTCRSDFSFATADYLIYNSVLVSIPDSLRKPAEDDVRIDRRGSKKFTWTLTDIPPRVAEPFAGARLNYAPSIYLQLVGYKSFWTELAINYVKDWADMSNYLIDYFKSALDSLEGVKPLVDSLLAGVGTNARRQIGILHAYVRDSVATTTEATELAIPTRNVAACLRERIGTAIDKNLLLIAMLRVAQFQADVYMCAGRDFAYFNPNVLNAAQFNHVLCLCSIGQTNYLLDSSTRDCPFPYLPANLRSVGGLRIGTGGWDTTAVAPRDWPSGINCSAAMTLHADGRASCTTHVTLTGYYQRRFASSASDNPTADDIVAFLPALRGKSLDLSQATRTTDSTGDSTTFDLVLEIADFGIAGDGNLVCTPSLVWTAETYFPDSARQFPVDFGYPTSRCESIEIHFDDGAAILQTPSDANSATPGLLFSRSSLVAATGVRVMSTLYVKDDIYPPEEYPQVKRFFDGIALNVREPITLKVD